jgi:hypothetical protein
LFTLFCYDESK